MAFGALVYPQRWCEQTQPHPTHVWVTSNGTYASCAGHSGDAEGGEGR